MLKIWIKTSDDSNIKKKKRKVITIANDDYVRTDNTVYGPFIQSEFIMADFN